MSPIDNKTDKAEHSPVQVSKTKLVRRPHNTKVLYSTLSVASQMLDEKSQQKKKMNGLTANSLRQ